MATTHKRVCARAVHLTDLPDDVLNKIVQLVPRELHAVCKRLRAAANSAITDLRLSVWKLQRPPDRQRLLRLHSLTSLSLSPGGDPPMGGVEQSVASSIALAWLEELPQLARLSCEQATPVMIPIAARLTVLCSLSLQNSREVADISPLASLTQLTSLNLSRTAVVDVCSLAALPSLQHLDLLDDAVGDRQIDLESLQGLTSIVRLD